MIIQNWDTPIAACNLYSALHNYTLLMESDDVLNIALISSGLMYNQEEVLHLINETSLTIRVFSMAIGLVHYKVVVAVVIPIINKHTIRPLHLAIQKCMI